MGLKADNPGTAAGPSSDSGGGTTEPYVVPYSGGTAPTRTAPLDKTFTPFDTYVPTADDPASHDPVAAQLPVADQAPARRPTGSFQEPILATETRNAKGITADPEQMRQWSEKFSSGMVYTPLKNSRQNLAQLPTTAKPGQWPSAKALTDFLVQAGKQFSEQLTTMQNASLYLGQAMVAVADMQEAHEKERQKAANDRFTTAVGDLQQRSGGTA